MATWQGCIAGVAPRYAHLSRTLLSALGIRLARSSFSEVRKACQGDMLSLTPTDCRSAEAVFAIIEQFAPRNCDAGLDLGATELNWNPQ